MKAIHNDNLNNRLINLTVFNTTNIQNESNSQHAPLPNTLKLYCIQYYKYTK